MSIGVKRLGGDGVLTEPCSAIHRSHESVFTTTCRDDKDVYFRSFATQIEDPATPKSWYTNSQAAEYCGFAMSSERLKSAKEDDTAAQGFGAGEVKETIEDAVGKSPSEDKNTDINGGPEDGSSSVHGSTLYI